VWQSGGGQDGARAALVGAIGCNVAWAIIDAVFYLMDSAFGRNRLIRIGRAVASAPDEAAALATIRGELDPIWRRSRGQKTVSNFYRGVRSRLAACKNGHPKPAAPRRAWTRDDYTGCGF
jgi:hypothetical protein